MSKQSDAKKNQNYILKPIPRTCNTCKNFEFDHIQVHPPTQWKKDGWWEDKNLRCSIGEFAVKKTATCDLYDAREINKENFSTTIGDQ